MRGVLAVIFSDCLLVALCLAWTGPAQAQDLVVTGTGTIEELASRCAISVTSCDGEVVDDQDCRPQVATGGQDDHVELVTRWGDVTVSGLFSGSGTFDSRALRNPCVAGRTQAPLIQDYHLSDITVCGRTGDMVIHATTTGEGDVTTPEGADTVSHFVITGATGQLQAVKGKGLIVSRATATSAFRTYYAEITCH